jgi:hypothetical protein
MKGGPDPTSAAAYPPPAVNPSDYPFARVVVVGQGTPDRYVWTEDPLGSNHLHGLKFVERKEDAAIYTAYRGGAIATTLLICRIAAKTKTDPVTFAEWAESEK